MFTTTKSRWNGWLIAGVLAMLGGCAAPAAKQSIVLVPDPAGHVGMAEVRTAAGAQVLRNAGDITQTSGASAAPSAVSSADASTISTIFGEALAAEPPPAQTFTLLFENNSSVLRAASLAQMDAIAEISQRRGIIRISISGHTDAVGSDKLNDALARARAEEVRQQLVLRRVSASLLTVSSHGKGNPLVVTPDGVAEPRNRRVVVIVR